MNDDQIFDYKSKDPVGDADLFGKYKHDWVETNFPNFSKNGHEIHVAETRNFIGCSIARKKILILSILTVIGIAIIFGRSFYLQAVMGGHYRDLAENNRVRLKPIASERGLIYDREGRQLVENVPSFSLTIVPQDLPQKTAERQIVINRIAQISGIPALDIENLLKKYDAYSYESLVVKDNLNYETALSLYIQNADLPGIVIEKGTKRLYRTNGIFNSASSTVFSLSHIIGYLGKINNKELETRKELGYLSSDYIGKDGLENQYELLLRGTYGRQKIEVDALGREQSVLAEESPVPGDHLILSIDLEAQEKMEELIAVSLQKNNWDRAAGIAMNPETGEILAIVSWPTYNNNDFSGGISSEKYNGYLSNKNNPLFSRAIAGTYPSGSIVKPLIAAAALQEGIINKNTTVLSIGNITIDKWVFRDWKAGGHGVTNVTKAIAWSVNTFFYYIGGGYKNFVGLGADKIVEYLKKFNLASKTGIDLPGEGEGFLPSKQWKEETKKEQWYVGDTYNLSIGEGDLLVTPLQAAVWTSAVANGGAVLAPRIVAATVNPVSKETTPIKIIVNNKNIISSANITIVQQGMRECVLTGSCQLLKSLPFTSAGKTGTAQWNANKENHAWFTAFAPFNNPKIVVAVLVEEGKEGSTAAQPIARDFLAWWGSKYLK